jgi:hypothetical protein
MLEIRYSAPCSLELAASVKELRNLRQDILELVGSDAKEKTFAADPSIRPATFDAALSTLIIAKSDGPTRVSLRGEGAVLIEGSLNCLEAFASFFDFEPDAEKATHRHFEYYESNEWIAPDSLPLVIRAT